MYMPIVQVEMLLQAMVWEVKNSQDISLHFLVLISLRTISDI